MDLRKHNMIFSPLDIHGKSIAVVGVGGLGSAVALELAKLGITDITLYDDDKVEPHNLPNQILYGPHDVGRLKVSAAAERIQQLTGYQPEMRNARVDGKDWKRVLHDYVFCCVDSMAAREHIFNKAVYMNCCTQLFVEGRIGASEVMAYILNPSDLLQVRDYRETLYPGKEVPRDVGACGNTPNIGMTAHIAAAYMVWLFVQWVKEDQGRLNEVLMSSRFWQLSARAFARQS